MVKDRCISNSGCDSGYCNRGTCATPDYGEPCHNDSNCSGSYVCAKNSKRCVDSNFTPSKPCNDHYDCSAEMYCSEGSCRQRGKLGDSCDPYSRLCKDGLGCYEENKRKTCHRHCHINESQFKCPSGFVCVAGKEGFDYCQRSFDGPDNGKPGIKPEDTRCTLNSQCEKTGFCLDGGYCSDKNESGAKFDNPCLSTNNCSGSLVCSSASKRCVYTNKINKPCIHQSDCAVGEYCNVSKTSCISKVSESQSCDEDFWCQDGLFCIKNEGFKDGKNSEKICRRKCLKGLSGFNCPNDFVCNNDKGHDGFDVCIPSINNETNSGNITVSPPSIKTNNNSTDWKPYLIGAGISLGVLLLLLILVFLFIRLRKKRERTSE